jgi:hypothetical protein
MYALTHKDKKPKLFLDFYNSPKGRVPRALPVGLYLPE